MLTIAIPQLYCGASGKRGAYNRQEVGLARAFAALGCRAVVLYPAPGAAAPETECPAPGVKVLYLPARAWRVNAFYQSWQPLLDEQVDAVHVMGDNSLGVPGLYRFCRRHGIFFYSQLGALRSQSGSAAIRAAMDLLCRRNLAIYRRTPSFAKTAAVQRELEALRVPCAGGAAGRAGHGHHSRHYGPARRAARAAGACGKRKIHSFYRAARRLQAPARRRRRAGGAAGRLASRGHRPGQFG